MVGPSAAERRRAATGSLVGLMPAGAAAGGGRDAAVKGFNASGCSELRLLNN